MDRHYLLTMDLGATHLHGYVRAPELLAEAAIHTVQIMMTDKAREMGASMPALPYAPMRNVILVTRLSDSVAMVREIINRRLDHKPLSEEANTMQRVIWMLPAGDHDDARLMELH